MATKLHTLEEPDSIQSGQERGTVTRRNAPVLAAAHSTDVFKLVFLTVVGLTVGSLCVCILLSVFAPEKEPVKELIATCSTTFKLGFGAIVGLLGGKALR